MIIGLEWILLVLAIIVAVLGILTIVFIDTDSICGPIFSIAYVILVIGLLIFSVCMAKAKDEVEDHYIEYLKLQTQVARYEDLDVLQQCEVSNQVMTYNLWYLQNESDLKNVWTLKGTTDCAKEFEYLVIGG